MMCFGVICSIPPPQLEHDLSSRNSWVVQSVLVTLFNFVCVGAWRTVRFRATRTGILNCVAPSKLETRNSLWIQFCKNMISPNSSPNLTTPTTSLPFHPLSFPFFTQNSVEFPSSLFVLRSGESSSLRGEVPETKFSTYYLDDNMRISRTSDDHVFVYVRAA